MMIRVAHIMCVVGFLAAAGTARAEWSATLLPLAGKVTRVRQVGGDVYIKAESWLQVSICDHGELCFKPKRPPAEAEPAGGIPDGKIASSGGRGVVRTWYSEPTDRYGHGVLGDRIEAGSLMAVDAAGRLYAMSLGPGSVFEDLTPRLADMDGDGMAEIATIRSRLDGGAALAIYGLRNGQLEEIGATDPLGRPNRWLNIAGIADFTGDGRLDIALIKTPHIGGRLEIWTFRSGSLARVASAERFSNHVIGSTELGLSAIADIDGDGTPELALPDAARTELRIVTVRDGVIDQRAAVAVGGRITTAIGVLKTPEGPIFVMGLEDGRAMAIRRN